MLLFVSSFNHLNIKKNLFNFFSILKSLLLLKDRFFFIFKTARLLRNDTFFSLDLVVEVGNGLSDGRR